MWSFEKKNSGKVLISVYHPLCQATDGKVCSRRFFGRRTSHECENSSSLQWARTHDKGVLLFKKNLFRYVSDNETPPFFFRIISRSLMNWSSSDRAFASETDSSRDFSSSLSTSSPCSRFCELLLGIKKM